MCQRRKSCQAFIFTYMWDFMHIQLCAANKQFEASLHALWSATSFKCNKYRQRRYIYVFVKLFERRDSDQCICNSWKGEKVHIWQRILARAAQPLHRATDFAVHRHISAACDTSNTTACSMYTHICMCMCVCVCVHVALSICLYFVCKYFQFM